MLRVGCIGAGYFSQFHVGAWARIAGAQLVAMADPNAAKARAAGVRTFADADAMLDAAALDIVDIITPPPAHLPLIRSALRRKPRAIICQKPFCQSLDQAQEAIRLAQSACIPLIIHENFRFQPWYRRIKAAMDGGAIGTPRQVTFRLRPGDGQGPNAYLDRQPTFQRMERFLVRETAVHWIDTFRYLLGPPSRVFADLRQENPAIAGEDAGHILFAYPGGARALFDGNRTLDHAAQNTRCTMGEALVEGTAGAITLAGDGSVALRRCGERSTTELLPPTEHLGFGGDCVYHLQDHVVRALLDGGVLENQARDYLAVTRTEEAVYRSDQLGRWVDLASPNDS